MDAVCSSAGQIHLSPFEPEQESLDQSRGSQELVDIHTGVGRIVYHPRKRISLLSPVLITDQKGSAGCSLASSRTKRVLGLQI